MKPTSWAHPEGRNGTHKDYAVKGAKKQAKAAKGHKRPAGDELRQQRLERDKQALRRLME